MTEAERKAIRVLLVDDDAFVLRALQRTFRAAPFDVTTVGSLKEAETVMREQRLDVVVTDSLMPEPAGVNVLRLAAELQPHTTRAMLSARVPDEAQDLIDQGILHGAFSKPWDRDFPEALSKLHAKKPQDA